MIAPAVARAASFPRPAAASWRRAEMAELLRTVVAALLVGVGYYLGAQIGFRLTFEGIPTSIFWLPNSTMFAVFLVVPRRSWWVYVLAAFPAHVAVQVQHAVPWPAMLLLFVTNLGDGALGALAVRAFGGGGRPRFDTFRGVAVFLVSAVGVTFGVSFLDAGVAVATGLTSDYWMVWHTRSRSNVLTNFLWVPAVVIAVTEGPAWFKTSSPSRHLEAAALALAHVVLASLVFGSAQPSTDEGMALLYAPLPLFVWAAARFGTGGVSTSLVGFALLVIWHSIRGHGPFARSAPAINILTLQVFLTLLAAPLLLLAAILEERRRVEAALRDREAQYRSIFESSGEGVLITDLDNAVVAANPAFSQLTGYPVEKLGGAPPGTFLHLDDLQPFDSFLAAAGTGKAQVAQTQALCVRQDGGLRRVELRGRRFDYGGVPHVLSVVRDVTEHEHAMALLEQRVAERTRELSTLLQISSTVASTLELEPLLRLVLEQLQTLVRYTGATIFGTEDEELVILAHRGPLSPEQVRRVRVVVAESSDAASIFHREGPLVVDDLGGDGASARALRAATPPEVRELFGYARSVIMVPLKARARVIGLLRIDSSEPDRYTLQDAELARALANQAAVAIENAYLYEQARGMAALEERQRLARELHDSVTQTLYASAMLGELLPRTWERDPAEGRRSLANLREMTRTALAEMRTLLLELRPGAVLQSDLGELLRQLGEALRSRSEAPITIDVKGSTALPPDVHVALYRVAQEALANVTRHAAATRVDITLECGDDGATLCVRDDGVGFDPATVGPDHLGLNIMRERLARIGGSLTIESAPGAGTLLTARWSMG